MNKKIKYFASFIVLSLYMVSLLPLQFVHAFGLDVLAPITTPTIPKASDPVMHGDGSKEDIIVPIKDDRDEKIHIGVSLRSVNTILHPLIIRDGLGMDHKGYAIPKSVIDESSLPELKEADLVDYRDFLGDKKSNIVYDPKMSREYKRALTWLSDNNILHGFTSYGYTYNDNIYSKTISNHIAPYDSYIKTSGGYVSSPISKADLVMATMKALDGVQWSRPLLLSANLLRDGKLIKDEPLGKSPYRGEVLKKNNLALNYLTVDYTKYGEYILHTTPNVYELYFTRAINNGILDLEEFNTQNQFTLDYIANQIYINNVNGSDTKQGSMKNDSGFSGTRIYPRWAVTDKPIRYNFKHEGDKESIPYILGSKPFGYSYDYDAKNIGQELKYNGDALMQEYYDFRENHLTVTEPIFKNNYQVLNKVNVHNETSFDGNKGNSFGVKYNPKKSNEYFMKNEMTVMDAFRFIYKSLKAYGKGQLTELESNIITSKFGIYYKDLSEEDKKVVNYLVAKGVINPEEYNSYTLDKLISQEQAYILLYRLCNKDARYNTNFQISNQDLEFVKNGYGQAKVKFQSLDNNAEGVSTEVISTIDTEPDLSSLVFHLVIDKKEPGKFLHVINTKGKKIDTQILYQKDNYITLRLPLDYIHKDVVVVLQDGNNYIDHSYVNGTGLYYINEGSIHKYNLSDTDVPSGLKGPQKDLIDQYSQNSSFTEDTKPHEVSSVTRVFPRYMDKPKGKSEVKLSFDRANMANYRYGDSEVFTADNVSSEFLAEYQVGNPTGEITANITSNICELTITSQSSTANSILAMMNKISVNGSPDATVPVAYIKVVSGEEKNQTPTMISEEDLKKFNVEVMQDTKDRGYVLRNTVTGVKAFLNPTLGKAFIGNEIRSYPKNTLMYISENKLRFYNMDVIVSMMNIDYSNVVTSGDTIIQSYKSSVNDSTTSIAVKSAIELNKQGTTYSDIDGGLATAIGTGATLTGTANTKQIGSVTYADLNSLTGKSNSFAFVSNINDAIKKIIIGYKIDDSVTYENKVQDKISSSLTNYINDIKMYPSKMFKVDSNSENRAKENLILNNAVAHTILKTTQSNSFKNKSFMDSVDITPIVNLVVEVPKGASVDTASQKAAKAYDSFIKELVANYSANRVYPFLGKETTMALPTPYNNDPTQWFVSRFNVSNIPGTNTNPTAFSTHKSTYNSANGTKYANINFVFVQPTDKGGFERTNWGYGKSNAIEDNIFISASDKLYVPVSGSYQQTGNIGKISSATSKYLGFNLYPRSIDPRISNIKASIIVEEPAKYVGIPSGRIPIEDIRPNTKVKVGSETYTVLMDKSLTEYNSKGWNVLNNEVTTNLLGDYITKAYQVQDGAGSSKNEIAIWDGYFKGILSTAEHDFVKAGVPKSSLFQIRNMLTGKDRNAIALDAILNVPTDTEFFRGIPSNNVPLKTPIQAHNFKMDTSADKYIIPMAGISKQYGEHILVKKNVKFLEVSNVGGSGVSLSGKAKEKKSLSGKINHKTNGDVLLGRPLARVKYGTCVLNTDNMKLEPFNTGSRYVKKATIGSPVADILSNLLADSLDIRYVKDLPTGSKININDGTIVKVSETLNDSATYSTFIHSKPVDCVDIGGSITPLALNTAKLLSNISITGQGLTLSLVNLTDMSSYVPPTLTELNRAASLFDKFRGATVTADSYSSENSKLSYALKRGDRFEKTTSKSGQLYGIARFDLNPYVQVVQNRSKTNEYTIIGFDLKATNVSTNNLKGYATVFKSAEDNSEIAKLWEDFEGITFGQLSIKDRSLFDPKYKENQVLLQTYSTTYRASLIAEKIKFYLCALIAAYCLIMMAWLPLFEIKPVRSAFCTPIGSKIIYYATFKRIDDPTNVNLKEYYPSLLLALFLVALLYYSLSYTILSALRDTLYNLVVILIQNLSSLF